MLKGNRKIQLNYVRLSVEQLKISQRLTIKFGVNILKDYTQIRSLKLGHVH